MIGAGLPVVTSLRLAAAQGTGGRLGRTLDDIARRVEAGATLRDAAAAHGDVFPALYLSLVHAGEAGGVLDTVLQRLATHLEQAAQLRRTVVAALAYPAVVVAAALAVTTMLLAWVVPVFAGVFASAGADLPAPTRLVLGLSSGVRAHAVWLAGGALAGAVALAAALGSDAGRLARDRWLLRLPGLGALLAAAAMGRAARTLGTLLGCGVAILEALDVAAETAGNRIVEEAFRHARTGLARGRSLAQPLAERAVVPPLVRQLVAAGERTGSLDTMLVQAADCCDDQVRAAAAALPALLEPVLVLVLGVVVGGLVIALYLPIFRLGTVLG